jgi:hypothetical protein
MPSHTKQQTAAEPPVDPGSIPDKTAESWDDKFTLTESRLKEWLFDPYERQRRPIYEAQKRLREQGVSEDIIGSVLYYDKDSTMERRYRQVLKLVTSSQTGQFWTCDALKLSGQISDAQIESIRTQHNGKLPPYYYIDSISRVYDNRSHPPKQYITCHFTFRGLRVGDVEGVVNQEPNLGIGTHGILDFTTW